MGGWMSNSGAGDQDQRSAAQVFEVLWRELVSVLGTAAAATLVRRAARRVAVRASELSRLAIVREGWAYRYVLPPGWADRPAVHLPAFDELVRVELVALLQEFTGLIVIVRLERACGLRLLGSTTSEAR